MKANLFFVVLWSLSLVSCRCCNTPPCGADGCDYSKESSWLVKTEKPTQAVDLLYFYPTVVLKGKTNCEFPNEAEKKRAMMSYISGPACMSGYTNVYVPHYRQVPFNQIVKYTTYQEVAKFTREQMCKRDIYAALDYYFKHINNGRPFILAGHSLGSTMACFVLDEYMPKHPEYMQRMVAAYLIGIGVPNSWLRENHLKGAERADDYGVIISYNTEGPGATRPSFLLSGDDYVINPITWTTGTQKAEASQNKGSFVWLDFKAGKYQIVVPGTHDAQVDAKRHVVVNTTDKKYWKTKEGVFGDKSLHVGDWPYYYGNLGENGLVRCIAYRKDHPATGPKELSR